MYYEDCEMVFLKTSFVGEYKEPVLYSLCFVDGFLDRILLTALAHSKQIMKLTIDP